jgi:hypothetical protein
MSDYETKNTPRLMNLIKQERARNEKKPPELSAHDYRNIKILVRKYVGKQAQFQFFYEGDRLIVFGHQVFTRGATGFISKGLQVWLSETPDVYGARLVTYSAESLMLRIPSTNGQDNRQRKENS